MNDRLVSSEWFQSETLSERARAWGATMQGYADNRSIEVRFAHHERPSELFPVDDAQNADDADTMSMRRPLLRIEREDREDRSMVPGATRATGPGNRTLDEEPDPVHGFNRG